MMVSDKYRILQEIDIVMREKVGIMRLREEDPDLYSYYLDWLERKEEKLVRKYRKKYGRLPQSAITV